MLLKFNRKTCYHFKTVTITVTSKLSWRRCIQNIWLVFGFNTKHVLASLLLHSSVISLSTRECRAPSRLKRCPGTGSISNCMPRLDLVEQMQTLMTDRIWFCETIGRTIWCFVSYFLPSWKADQNFTSSPEPTYSLYKLSLSLCEVQVIIGWNEHLSLNFRLNWNYVIIVFDIILKWVHFSPELLNTTAVISV